MRGLAVSVVVVAVGCTLLSSQAVAQPSSAPAPSPTPEPASPRPWANGVAKPDQDRALQTFREANQLFSRKQYNQAARQYRLALKSWRHPSVQGNLAVALIHLDKPVEAYTFLEGALRYGAAPFSPHIYQQLIAHQKLLRGQVSHIVIDCSISGASVTLDGAPVLGCPKTDRRVVRAGQHEVVARKRGYLTYAQRFFAEPGKNVQVKVSLVPISAAARIERRWATWKPWTVAAGGLAVMAVGAAFQLASSSNTSSYERSIAQLCPAGCVASELPDAVADLRNRARLQNRIGVSALILGGTAALAGGALVFTNRPRRVPVDESGRRVQVVPVVYPRGIALSVVGRY